MKISIFGLGYVGCVSAGCLGTTGHTVIGVDLNEDKVNQINSGKATIVEKDIDIIIKKEVANGSVSARIDSISAVLETDISIVCVGTPTSSSGHLDFSAIFSVCRDIGKGLKDKNSFHTIAIRSTIMPGLCNQISNIISEESGKKSGEDFYVLSNPEFLREGCAVKDYFNPPFILIGSNNDYATSIMEKIYKNINAEIVVTELNVAEIIKYVNNSFHALKVAFGNEIGNICKSLDIDSHKLMDIFVKDNQLNISPYYLKPGFAYGGSCLPKDLKALNTIAFDKGLEVPVLSSIEGSNKIQVNRAFEFIRKVPKNNLGYLGISFKEGTDDLRNSPNLDLIKMLIKEDYKIRVYDNNVYTSMQISENKSIIDENVNGLSSMIIDDIKNVIKSSDLIVIGNKDINYLKHLQNFNGYIIDLVNLHSSLKDRDKYIGINW